MTHIGTGQAKVEQVASNRRYTAPDGRVLYDRMSRTKKREAREADEGLIDPWLKMLSFWNGDREVAAVSFYAVHPMSYYGEGEVSADFPGMARRQLQAGTPETLQIYASGCSGNVTAGKFNDGAHENRAVLAGRLTDSMQRARAAAQRTPLERVAFRSEPLRLEPRRDAGFSPAELEAKLVPSTEPFQQCLAAMGLNWRRRADAGHLIRIPCLDFGSSQLILLPGEAYVEYQLAAQAERPDSFVCVAGYGEAACGYVPTEKHFDDYDPNLADWCWVAPGCEARMRDAIRRAMGRIGAQ